MLRYLTERLPVMVTPSWVGNRIQPIAVRDVLRYLVAAAAPARRASTGPSTSAAPTCSPTAEMMPRYAAVAGLPARRDRCRCRC